MIEVVDKEVKMVTTVFKYLKGNINLTRSEMKDENEWNT